ncbi:gamma-glutamyl-gamma-aminobutyrate hydrolase PuuD [Enterococcus sp. PF1-24]|nr:gamma-glutamyl-gamma-aminobutyrate hydrolase PuuD [Enterococcus sp. PFB1-1]MDH6401902.1 gamma-glutamyl-gamma-aminobutyrate hydrolase PuuD [Enterococcus sp. PF1-24]
MSKTIIGIAGGQDVDPHLYNEVPHPKLLATNPARDTFEMTLVLEAIHQKKPIFAVCRGIHLLNVALGGTLYQDLSLYDNWQVKHNQVPTPPSFATHNITVDVNSRLSFLPENYRVNSFHHQAIKKLAPSLRESLGLKID